MSHRFVLRRARARAPVLTLWAALLMTVACSGAPEVAPTIQARRASSSAIGQSIREAREESDEQERYQVLLRHNPTRCPGPAFEIFAYGSWLRVFVETDDPTLQAQLDQFARGQEDGGLLGQLTIVGKFASSRRRSSRGLKYRVFELIAIGALPEA